ELAIEFLVQLAGKLKARRPKRSLFSLMNLTTHVFYTWRREVIVDSSAILALSLAMASHMPRHCKYTCGIVKCRANSTTTAIIVKQVKTF
ncbi:hypothetical protein AVEN_110222-1, partial [Araneus ventricosus]